MRVKIVLLLFVAAVSAFNVTIVSSRRADLLVFDDSYLRPFLAQRCFETCAKLNFTVNENVLLFERDLQLDRQGNLTVWADEYAPNGLFRNMTHATAQIVPPPIPEAPPSPLWYLLWLSLFVVSFPIGFLLSG